MLEDAAAGSKALPYCGPTPTERADLHAEARKPILSTSQLYETCNLPKRFEYPHWFYGYGSQVNKQHPFYRTTSSDYGWLPPGYHSVPNVFFAKGQKFSARLMAAGMYRNYSLNTGMDRSYV